MVTAYFEQADWREYIDCVAEIYRARRDTMLDALAEHFPPQAEWTHPSGGLFIWATLPDFIDTTDLLARALRENVAFVPGAAAYLDGRGHNAMRLNFSAVDESDIREGVRRIGKVVAEQLALYGTLTGKDEKLRASPEPVDDEGAQVVRLPTRRSGEGRAQGK
jgi:2-aminoadipate transaminase